MEHPCHQHGGKGEQGIGCPKWQVSPALTPHQPQWDNLKEPAGRGTFEPHEGPQHPTPRPPSLSCCVLDERPNLSRPQLLHPLREACDNLHQVPSGHSTTAVIIIIISHCVQEFLVGAGRAEKGEREQTGNHFSKALRFQVRQEHFPPSPPNTRGCTQTHPHTHTHTGADLSFCTQVRARKVRAL